MRALRSCDFCDAEAVGTFEVVPPELEPTDAEQRRVVLCRDCSRRLDTLLEPLLARLGADGTAATGSGPVVATTDASTATRTHSSSSNAAEGDGGDADRSTVDADDTVNGTGVAGTATGSDEGGSIDGITVEHDAQSGETDRDSGFGGNDSTASEAGADATAETDGDETTAADTADAEANGDEASADRDGESGTDAVAAATATRDHPSKAYAKVVRLLRNREFPMERDAVESLAAGAYDLENHEVEAIIDRAIEDGEFTEDGRLLRRP
ncbi:hypothetical protein [Halosolutus halophilus]|uniref:hypothetical protein n=1 Tax=Halosolutus halophilus TaxID=1552990 RepID=UPI00223524DC|nr:hypothetical protein [Halosolutus halophilus]